MYTMVKDLKPGQYYSEGLSGREGHLILSIQPVDADMYRVRWTDYLLDHWESGTHDANFGANGAFTGWPLQLTCPAGGPAPYYVSNIPECKKDAKDVRASRPRIEANARLGRTRCTVCGSPLKDLFVSKFCPKCE
jgi:hypothetical protein